MNEHQPRWEDMVRYDAQAHTIATLDRQRILCSCGSWSSSWVARTPDGIRSATQEWQEHTRPRGRRRRHRR